VYTQCKPFLGVFARAVSTVAAPATVLFTLTSSAYATTDLPIQGAAGKSFQVPFEQVQPDQLLVVVNTADRQSVDVADEYMATYDIPSANRLELSFPKTEVMLSSEFDPVYSTIQSSLQSKPELQAIVITWTEPWKVSPPDSTAGMGLTSAVTFGFLPEYYNDSDRCDLTAVSPLYGMDLSAPFTDFGLRPTMMLAGENAQKAIDVVDRSVDAKGTFPLPTGYLVRTTDEIRSVRYFDMEEADDFWTSPFGLQIDYRDNSQGPDSNNYIKNRDDVLYYFTGLSEVDYLNTLTFVPGAVADHLTSFGGELTGTRQMSILRWLEAGASGSYGTVAEPCNVTDKFTNITMFLQRYFTGVPLIDAYWHSVREPGEGIFVGDPMAQPYASKARINVPGQVEFTSTRLLANHIYKVTGVDSDGNSIVLLNGVRVGDTPELRVLELPAGFETYKLIDTGTLYDDHGAPNLNADSITKLHLTGGVWQFDIRADDPQDNQVYYSFQLANGTQLSQSNDFAAEVVLDGDIDRDGYVNFSDLGLLKGAMLSQVGDDAYLPAADLSNDGTVDFLDVGMLNANFGGTHSYVRFTSHIDGTKDIVVRAFDKYGSESQMTVKVGDGDLVVVDP
jgi:uncharacterized protein (TIGR03790 family)